MKRTLIVFLFLTACASIGFAGKVAVVLRPGDTIYARFEVDGRKIRLVSASKEQDPAAQVVVVFDAQIQGIARLLRVENKFSRDLIYKLEMRSLSKNHQGRGRPTPVVAGKMAFDTYGAGVEEIELFDFKLEK